MKHYKTISQQFETLQNFQHNLFQAIKYRQKQLEADLKNRVDKYNCQIERKRQIQLKNVKQQIKHPNNNGMFRILGECIQQHDLTDLDQIRYRQLERQKQRQRILQYKSLQAKGMELYKNTQISQQQNEQKGKKKNKQIPWKLMRKLRQQDVQQNKKRIQKKLQDKLSKIKRKFV